MSKIKEARQALDLVDRLTERALAVACGPPYSHYIDEGSVVHLYIEESDAVLEFSEIQRAEYDFGDAIIASEVKFPVALLFLSEEEFQQWTENRKAEADCENEDRRKQREKAQEQEERFMLSQLLKKYGSAP